MKYCSECGAPVVLQRQRSAHAWRYVCETCRIVFYQAPRLAAACIAEWEHRILLCRRAVEPEFGCWELPAGFVASGESAAAAARRETLEEAGVGVSIDRPYALLHIPSVNQFRVVYLACLLDTTFRTGAETSDARLFAEHEIPWEKVEFATTRDTLRHYLAERREGKLGFFFAEIVPAWLDP
ncbi:MAG: NUDIX hydrolase [Proteobacteria bacterium]|jgi:ADP-ribose pyrophosphatase YjhB (NUDIX family)|nr:NUDIX hydrolase [Pseudomonadota bacterium]